MEGYRVNLVHRARYFNISYLRRRCIGLTIIHSLSSMPARDEQH